MLVLFDHLLCDEEAFKAEEAGYRELGWLNSELFVDLKAKGVLVTVKTDGIVSRVKRPSQRLGPVGLDAYYAAQVQRQLGHPIFDWDRKLVSRTRTLAPSPGRTTQPRGRASLKLAYLWRVIANANQITPPLDSLTGAEGSAYRRALTRQAPWWRRLERIEIGLEEYITALTSWRHLYQKVDSVLRPAARLRYEQFLRYRDKTERERLLIRPLVIEAFEKEKSFPAYAARVQTELSKALPSLFPAVAEATGKVLLGMVALTGPGLVEYFGYPVPDIAKRVSGPAAGIWAARSAYNTVTDKIEQRRKANPLRFMIKASPKHFPE
jgi:hypothetical protein